MHRATFRVYYEDTDFSGFVYHANYLRFLERGRTDFLRDLGVTQSSLHAEVDGFVFVVARLVLGYLRPALMDDVLVIKTTVVEVGGASMRMHQQVVHGSDVLVRADVTIAAVRSGRAVRLPRDIRETLLKGTESPSAT